MSISNRSVCTVSIHPSEIWGPNWRGVEKMLDYWAKNVLPDNRSRPSNGLTVQSPEESSFSINARTPPLDSGVEKARNHPNPYYRK